MRKVRLGDVCQIVSGSTPKTNIAEYWDGNFDWITPAELNKNTFVLDASARKITELGAEKTGLKAFPQGTVILSSRAPIGKVAIAGKEMYCNQGFKNLICSDDIYNEFLYWFLKGKTEYLNSLGRGATFKEISKGIVENIEINLPDFDDQVHVAAILKKCWFIIQLKKKELIEFDDLIKARFVELFGDPELNEKGWIQGRLGDYCRVINGRAYKAEELLSSGKYKVLRVGNFFTSENWYYSDLELESDKYCDFGDLLFAWSASFGPKIWDGDKTIYHYHIWKLDDYTENLNKNFFVEHLNYNCEIMKRSTHGSTMAHFTKGQMEDQVMVIPPMELQNQFAVFVEQVDKSKVAIQKSLDEVQILYNKLMQEYFE